MPGIVGLITKTPRKYAEQQLLRMVEAIRHESSYGTGTWIDESLGVYVGWTVLKGSFSDGMPVCNERGDVTLVFSGEEYPEPRITCHLKEKGHTLGVSGSSYLVHLYEDDPAFPAGLNGLFHGLLADRTRGSTTLFNDRYGMHRIYYHESTEAFFFAVEAKAILAVRPDLRAVDPRSLGEFVTCGCVLENRSLFAGVQVLPPASTWVFRGGSIDRKGSYFTPREWEDQTPQDPESYYQELRESFARNLPRYFSGQQRIAMSLTGGLDTRMIMAWRQPPRGSLPCYSFGGMFRDCQDVIMARKVAQASGQCHEIIPVGEEFLSRFPKYAERTIYVTDGCADVSRSSDLYVNERAAQIAPVRMTGNYGSEILRPMRPAFKPVEPAPGLFCTEFLSHVQTATHTYASLLRGGHPVSFAAFRQAPWHHYGLLALERSQLVVRSPYLDNDLVQTVFRAPKSLLANSNISLRLIEDGNPALLSIRTDRGLAGSHGRLYAAISRGVLDLSFKAEYAYDYGMPQWLARIDHLLLPLHLERAFLGRHKFYHFRVWYRDVLSAYVREMLLDPRTLSRPYLKAKRLETIVQSHLRGERNYTTAIHKVLTLELLHRLFVDAPPACRSDGTQHLPYQMLAESC